VRSFDGFQDAYLHQVGELLREPRFRAACGAGPDGRGGRERLGAGFTLRDPLRRLVTHRARRVNLVFHFAEALWHLAGRDDLDYLAYYAPRLRNYSADGLPLTGSAHGLRIFRYGDGVGDQWAAAALRIKEDPDTRCAVIQVFHPRELLVPGNPDVARTLALQYVLREGRIHAITYIRAGDVYRGMVSDVFSFTFLQEMMARQLRVPVGSYTHIIGSLRLRGPDAPKAGLLLSAPASVGSPPDRMPALPRGGNRGHLARVLELEHELRTGRLRLRADEVDTLGLPSYWADVVVLFELYRRVRAGESGGDALADRLPPLYRHLMDQRFPSLADPDPLAAKTAGAAA
jgi:thymidylate synthase